MRLIFSFTALFLSVVMLQLGLGGVVPLDALSGDEFGFSKAQIGFLGSAHFFGFFIGCWWAPRLMGEVGHSRAFAALTATGVIGIMAHMMVIDPWAWALMRAATGLSVAGTFTIIEAWLQAKVTNATRGRAMAIYRIVDVGSSLSAQLLIAILPAANYLSYNILALVLCTAVFPLTLTKVSAPPMPEAPRLRPMLAWQCSPLGSLGVVVSGVTGAAFRMVGPIYGLEVGLKPDQIALFMAAYVLGGALAQFPVGWAADKHDRRKVLIGLSLGGIAACVLTILLQHSGTAGVFIAAGVYGFFTIPIYSLATAHAHDFADPMQRVELSAAMMFLYALGAIAAPMGIAAIVADFGPGAMFVMLALILTGLISFGLMRMQARPARIRTAYTYEPRTSFLIGRLLGRIRDRQ
jgi:MFS family permease